MNIRFCVLVLIQISISWPATSFSKSVTKHNTAGIHILYPRNFCLYGSEKEKYDIQASIKKNLGNILASVAAMQSFMGPTVASNFDDSSYNALTNRLTQKILKAKILEKEITEIKVDTSKSVSDDVLHTNIENILNSKFSIPSLDPNSLHLGIDMSSVRDSVRYLTTDWKAWVCALTLVAVADTTIARKELRRLTQQQKEQIDSLYAKLKFLEESGIEKEGTISIMRNETAESTKQLESLSMQLKLRTEQLQQLQNALQDVRDMDSQLLNLAKQEKLQLLENITRVELDILAQKEVYDNIISKKNDESSVLQAKLMSTEQREVQLLDAVKSFLVQQEFVGQGVANMMLSGTALETLANIQQGPTYKQLSLKADSAQLEGQEMQKRLDQAEREVERLLTKVAYTNGKLEESTVYQLQAMERVNDFKSRLSRQDGDIRQLQRMLDSCKVQLARSDALCNEAVVTAADSVKRAVFFETENARLTNLLYGPDSGTNSSVVSENDMDSVLKVADARVRAYKQELDVANSKLEAAQKAERVRVAAELKLQSQSEMLTASAQGLEDVHTEGLPNANANRLDHWGELASDSLVPREQLIQENTVLKKSLLITQRKLIESEDRVESMMGRLDALERLTQGLVPTGAQEHGVRLDEYIRELVTENEDLKDKLLTSEDRMWDLQQDAQAKIDSVKNLALELTEKLGMGALSAGTYKTDEDEDDSVAKEEEISGNSNVAVLTKPKNLSSNKVVLQWKTQSNELEEKRRLEGALRALGVRPQGGFADVSKTELVALLQETLSASSIGGESDSA